MTTPVIVPSGDPLRLIGSGDGAVTPVLVEQEASGDSLYVNIDLSGDDLVTSGSGLDSESGDDADDEYAGSGASGDGSVGVRAGGDGSSLRFKR